MVVLVFVRFMDFYGFFVFRIEGVVLGREGFRFEECRV